MGDTITGYMLLAQICAALYRKKETGLGDYVRAGLYHTAIFTMGTMAIYTQPPFGYTGYPTDRESRADPSGEYQCGDGEWVFLSGYSAAMLSRLYTLLGREDILEDPRFDTPEHRLANAYAYIGELQKAFKTQPAAHWLARAEEMDLPMIRMGHFSDIATDEQAWANGYLEHVEFRSGNVDVMPRSPIEMDSVGELVTVPAPSAGADSAEILKKLGYTDAQLEQMQASGAVRID